MKCKLTLIAAALCASVWASTPLRTADDCPQATELQQFAFTLAPIAHQDQNQFVTSFVHLTQPNKVSQNWTMGTFVNADGLDIAAVLKEANRTLQAISGPASLRTLDGKKGCVFFANNSVLVAMPFLDT